MDYRKKSFFIKSRGGKVYVELTYPKNFQQSAPAIIVAHGLRSYYTGFLNMFCKYLRDAGYIAVKFHFVGTGKSSGKFEEKSTAAMLQNLRDVVDFVAAQPEVRGIGFMGRSNAGDLVALHGPDPRIKAYSLLAPAAYYSLDLGKFIDHGKVRGKFFYHHSFKRPHTKGPGRLPLSFMAELRRFDKHLLHQIKKIKPVIFFQSTADEAVPIAEGHFAYWKKNLPSPKKIVLIQGGNHSYKGHKHFVIEETIRWFKKYLPVR